MHVTLIGSILVILILGSIPFAIADQNISEPMKSENLTISLVGTVIDHESMIIDSNIDGNISLTINHDGYCNVLVNFRYGMNIQKESKGVPIVKKISILSNNRDMVTMDISDYYEGIFISIRILNNNSLSLYVATEYDDVQYSAHKLLDRSIMKPNMVGFLVSSYSWSRSCAVNNQSVIKKLEEERAPSTIPQIRAAQGMKSSSPDNVEFAPTIAPVYGPKIYFLNHYMSDFRSPAILNVGEDLIDNSWITHELRRENPSVSQVKADLKFCSKKYYYKPDWYSKVIGAYMVNAHGNYDEQNQEIIWFFEDGWVDSTDISSCWIISDTYYCSPDDCIISSLTCYGLYYPTMGDAFMDHGAWAYIGSDETTPGNLKLFIDEFWGENLAIGDTSIDYALDNSFLGCDFDCYYESSGTHTLPN